ncbi:amidohydrolase family protein [Streptomyces kanasensis]|uniref:amidohydrolase family protein n=1 Tax=Streptomyces kanasensis TaxID=936756 RepID=UPI0036F8570E
MGGPGGRAGGGTGRAVGADGTPQDARRGGDGGGGRDGGDREAVAVRAVARRLGLPGLLDVHTHFMPDRVLRKVWAYFDGVEDLTGVAWPITYREEEDRRVDLLRRFGVLRFTSMVYPHKAGMARWLNDWAAGFAARVPECLCTGTLYPEEGVGRYVTEHLARGARVFKVHLQVGDFDPNDPLLDPAWGALADARVPVVVHCGSGPTPGAHTGPGPVGRLLSRYPRLRLVVAHMGMPEYTDFLDLAERYDEVRLDTTMVFTDFSERLAPFPRRERGRLLALGDRVLLGSDFPNIPYGYLHQLEALERLGLGDDWLRGVLHGNAAALFADPGTGAAPAATADPGTRTAGTEAAGTGAAGAGAGGTGLDSQGIHRNA